MSRPIYLLSALQLLCGCSSPATPTAGVEGPGGAVVGGSGGAAGTSGIGGAAPDGAAGWLPDGTQSVPIDSARPDAQALADAPARESVDAPAPDLRVRSDAQPPEGGFRYPNPDGRLCGQARHTLARRPAELLLVLDRSNSMELATTPGRTRWDDARDAVIGAVGNASTLAWGLKVFPSIGDLSANPLVCGVATGVEVAVGFGHAGVIGNALMHAGPPTAPLGDGTPTEAAVLAGTAYLTTLTTPFPKYMVLVTDGQPFCLRLDGRGVPEIVPVEPTIAAIADAAAAGIKTFVIGISAATLASNLNRMADAGGMPRAAEPRYYPAENRVDLDAALQAIARTVTTCILPLVTRPLDPDFVGVTVGSKRVPRDLDRIDGWDYVNDGTAIEIYGPACDTLKSGTAPTTEILFGCPS